jgi:hypothetical protein
VGQRELLFLEHDLAVLDPKIALVDSAVARVETNHTTREIALVHRGGSRLGFRGELRFRGRRRNRRRDWGGRRSGRDHRR